MRIKKRLGPTRHTLQLIGQVERGRSHRDFARGNVPGFHGLTLKGQRRRPSDTRVEKVLIRRESDFDWPPLVNALN